MSIVEYLRGSGGLNLSRRNIKVYFDDFDDAPDILRQIRSFIRDRREKSLTIGQPITDLIVYYIGHGGITLDSNAFFIAIRSTSVDDPLATSITAESLGRLIRDEAAGLRSYILLDCCFAASLTKVFMSGGPLGVASVLLTDKLPPQGDNASIEVGKWPEYGIALLCASGSSEAALAPQNLQHTMFTGCLLEVLRDGDPHARVWLSLNDMQRLVRRRPEAQFSNKAVLPQLHAPQQRMGRVDLVPLFHNPARATAPLPPNPPELGTENKTVPQEIQFRPLTPIIGREESQLRSIDGRISTCIKFVNNLAEPVSIYWVSYEGIRVHYAIIGPGQSLLQQTYVTHPWIVTRKDVYSHGQPIAIFEPVEEPGIAQIGQ